MNDTTFLVKVTKVCYDYRRIYGMFPTHAGMRVGRLPHHTYYYFPLVKTLSLFTIMRSAETLEHSLEMPIGRHTVQFVKLGGLIGEDDVWVRHPDATEWRTDEEIATLLEEYAL